MARTTSRTADPPKNMCNDAFVNKKITMDKFGVKNMFMCFKINHQ